ncbi:MAG TPA: site-2 protease family protein, partial [Stellaceae bacterium]|nr:site-2 protease family protein [Stellaceae bacterium]
HRVKLLTLAGFTVWIDASWLIFAGLFAWTLAAGVFPSTVPGLPTATYWWMAVAGAIGLLFSIIFHELSHSLVARRFAIPISGITLFIFGGVAELGGEPNTAKSEFLMAVVGPITSMVLGTLLLAATALGTGALPRPVLGLLSYLGYINWVLALFNLVPAFPLDGGRMLRAALWGWRKDLRWATNVAAGAGAVFGIGLILWGVFEVVTGNFVGGIWLFLIGMFLHGAAGEARQQMLARQALAGRPVAAFMTTTPVAVTPDLSIRALVEDYFYRYHYKAFPICRDGRLVGCITSRQVRQTDREQWERLAVGQVMEPCSPDNTVSPDADALDALMQMQRTGNSRLLVVEQGRLAGILSLRDMLQFLSLKLELGDIRPPSGPFHSTRAG